jgi:hypothetical protein
MKIFFILIFIYINIYANINIIKKENNDSNTTLLIIGGIHGNEPGGFFTPSILASHYTITSKNVWIIPNLNRQSIIANRRGINGDMNRKFAKLSKDDEDKEIIQEIKKVILLPRISLILNLHDGHGFYRKKSQNSIYNPKAWGQTCVIDQCKLDNKIEFGNLDEIAYSVQDNVNKRLIEKHHTFNVKNTNTKTDDKAMQLSLTYFAVLHDKPAFAIETSKNLSSLSQKVFYQLLAIEEYMNIMDITFKRDFELNERNIRKLVKNYGILKINNRISLDLNDIKKHLSYIPIKSENNMFVFSHNLGEIKKNKEKYEVFIGNKKITTLKPQLFSLCEKQDYKVAIEVDGVLKYFDKASNFSVNTDFKVLKQNGYRVNIIGFTSRGASDESGYKISLNNLNKHFSIDRHYKKYRVEFYNKTKFCFMLTAEFK